MSVEEMVSHNLIFLGTVGSEAHGLAIGGTDDHDLMGVCIEPPEYVIGMKKFEHCITRTQPEGVRSGPEDIDKVVYSLRKYVRLASAGNPSILVPLFISSADVAFTTSIWQELQRTAYKFATKQAGEKFLGYMRSQRSKMLGERGGMPNRPELIERYGFDTKFAAHMVRLGIQGEQFLETGQIPLPIPEPDRTWLRELRVGEHTQQEALDVTADLEVSLEKLIERAYPWTDRFARETDDWLIVTYLEWWEKTA